MPPETKENPAQTCGRELPALDPPAWAPSQLVALYEEHRSAPDRLPPNFNRESFFSTLRVLICAPRMERVWSSLEQYQTPTCFPNLLFSFALEALKGPSPEWVSLTPKQREKKLSMVDKLARELNEITVNTPLEALEPETIEALGLDVPDVWYPRGDGWLGIILSSVASKAAALRGEPPILKQTKGEHARRRLLFHQLNKLLGLHCAANMYEQIATIASVVLIGDDPDETIDTDTVRKSLTYSERDRMATKSRSD